MTASPHVPVLPAAQSGATFTAETHFLCLQKGSDARCVVTVLSTCQVPLSTRGSRAGAVAISTLVCSQMLSGAWRYPEASPLFALDLPLLGPISLPVSAGYQQGRVAVAEWLITRANSSVRSLGPSTVMKPSIG